MFTVSALGNLERGSDRAAFRQIADHLRSAIERGELREGGQLPSEAQLMEHYGVARMTVRSALQQLQAEGLTFSQHGKGVYVRSRPPVRRLASDRLARRHREAGKAAFIAEADKVGARPGVDMIEVSEESPIPEIAERLRLRRDDLAVVRRRRYLLDGRPVELATSYIPAAIAHGTAIERENTGPGGIYARLEELGHRLDHFEEEVSTRMPTADETRALGLLPAVPVIHLVRTAYAADGYPVEVCDTIMAGDSYVLSYELPAR
jgi:GntR family transcriptional regulator